MMTDEEAKTVESAKRWISTCAALAIADSLTVAEQRTLRFAQAVVSLSAANADRARAATEAAASGMATVEADDGR